MGLLTHFHATICDAQDRPLTAVLWSRFPVCCSCNDATKQLQQLLPRLQLTIVELDLLEVEPIDITELEKAGWSTAKGKGKETFGEDSVRHQRQEDPELQKKGIIKGV